jgi:hypothetical protein
MGVALLCAAPARADVKEWALTLTPAYGVIYVDSRTAHGGGAAVDVAYGVSDTIAVHARGLVTWHDVGPVDTPMPFRGGALSAFSAMAGVTYTLDVIRLVPSFDLSIGALGVYGGAGFGDAPSVLKPVVAFGVAVGFAIDYLWTRHFALGAEVKYQAALAPGVFTGDSRIGMYLYAGPRVVFRFGVKN